MPTNSKYLKGLPISPGTVLGRVVVIERDNLAIPRYNIGKNSFLSEQERLDEAVAKSIAQLDDLLATIGQDGLQPEQQALLQANKLILQDDLFIGLIKRNIVTANINAEWAVSRATNEIGNMFANLESPYFRERRSDVAFIGKQLLKNLLGHNSSIPQVFGERTVVVADDLSAIDIIQLAQRHVLALVTALGGPASHGAIIARSFGLPAVFCATDICLWAHDGQTIGVDGTNGDIFLSPEPAVAQRLQEEENLFKVRQAELLYLKDLPAVTQDGYTIHLMGNIEFPEEVAAVNDNGGEGIGLYRTEFLFVDRQDAPTEEEHFSAYKQVIELAAGREVTIRTIDIGFDKTFLAQNSTRAERNPALGLRAIRLCRKYPELLKNQLAGLLRAAVCGPVKILIPMVSSLDDVLWVKNMLREVAADLAARGIAFQKNVPLGVMIEVPAAVAIADLLAAEVDFFSLGTNDLIQYCLALDRSNEELAQLYSPLHPAILRMIDSTVKVAHQAGIGISVCGELGSYPAYAVIFAALGIDAISMNSAAIPIVKRALRNISTITGRNLWDNLLTMRSAAELNAYCQQQFNLLGLK